MSENVTSSEIGFWEIGLSYFLILAALGLSRFFKLGLEKDFWIASVRTILQLILIGYVLAWVFDQEGAGLSFLIFSFMTVVAAQAASSRVPSGRSLQFVFAMISLLCSVWPVGLLTLVILRGLDFLTDAKFSIPLFGLLLGNSLNSISIALIGIDRVRRDNRDELDALRALGATEWESAHRQYRDIIRSAVTPILNGLTVVGIVSLPGVMAGQVLAGAEPLVAAKFQIVVMFVIAFTSLLGSLVAVLVGHRMLIYPHRAPARAGEGGPV